MIVLFSVFFFESLRSGTNLRSRIVTLHVRVCQRSVIRDHQQKIAGKCQGLSSPDRFVIDVLLLFYNKNVGESCYSISSWSGSSGYSTLMLTEGTRVDSSSTRQLWSPSVNISVEYPELPDHDSMNNPSLFCSSPLTHQLLWIHCNLCRIHAMSASRETLHITTDRWKHLPHQHLWWTRCTSDEPNRHTFEGVIGMLALQTVQIPLKVHLSIT